MKQAANILNALTGFPFRIIHHLNSHAPIIYYSCRQYTHHNTECKSEDVKLQKCMLTRTKTDRDLYALESTSVAEGRRRKLNSCKIVLKK